MLVPLPRDSWLTRPRLVGTPLRWSAHAGALGAVVGGLAPLAIVVPLTIPWTLNGLPGPIAMLGTLVAGSLAAAAAGGAAAAAVGLDLPDYLERVRGRWPLPLIGLPAALMGAICGSAGALGWLLPPLFQGAVLPIGLMSMVIGAGAVVGAAAAAAWWLPFAMATVLGRAWPVTRAVGLGIPAVLAVVLAALVL